MTIDTNDLINSILSSLSRIDYIKPEDLPNIELYMDQVTTFMEQQLAASKRNSEDKILTKTMINNYTKNRLLPPPVKKKYTREHILMLIFIYYFKNILSISDIQDVLNPLAEQYFGCNKTINLEAVYQQVFQLEKGEVVNLQKDIEAKFKTSQNTFELPELNAEEKDDLQDFAFLCMLSFDVYVKKQLIEKLIDTKFHNYSVKDRKK
jgi:DNA-binding transcriptional MerR regulator